MGDSVGSMFALLMAVGLGIRVDSGVGLLDDRRGSVLTATSGHNQLVRRIAGHEEQRLDGMVCRRASGDDPLPSYIMSRSPRRLRQFIIPAESLLLNTFER